MDLASLKGIPLFESLSTKELREVAQRADEIDLAEGAELVRQGEFAYEFFVLLEGSAEVVRDGDCIAVLGSGDFLGEMGILGGATRNASVTATSQVRALVMSEQEFRSMAAVLPNVADRIRAACDRRAKTLEAPPAG
jgi:CRP/FNR family transcriptional regulator, cyclic AMP receptor protein